jgi:hypothetical protein
LASISQTQQTQATRIKLQHSGRMILPHRYAGVIYAN